MKIVVAIDGSPCSMAMLNEIARRPWPPGSILRVVTVDAPLEPSLLKGSPSVLDDLARQKRTEASRILLEAEDKLRRNVPGVTVEARLLEGWPKEAIIDEAEQWGADLIVVGSHGYGTIRRFFIGSVSLTIATNATCSVLIVRPRPDSMPS